MKRFIASVLVFVLVFSCVGAYALGGRTLTTERLLGDILAGFAGIPASQTFSFDYEASGENVHGGLFKDEDGDPVVKGEFSSGDEFFDLYMTSDGVILESAAGAQGMRWWDIVQMLLEEAGLGRLSVIAPDDIKVIEALITEIAGGITDRAVSVIQSDTLLDGASASKLTIAVNAGQLILDLDTAVPCALTKNSAALDSLLERWMPVICEIVPDADPETDTAALIELWQSLKFYEATTEGMDITAEIVSTGGMEAPWRADVTVMDKLSFEIWQAAGRVQFILNMGEGQLLTFDSGDIEYLLSLAGQLQEYITEEAICFKDETVGGVRDIRFTMDGFRLQKQLITAIVQIIAENKADIDALIDKYRAWLQLCAPEAAGITSDTLVMALTIVNASARNYGMTEMLGFGNIISNYLNLQISYPVRDTLQSSGAKEYGYYAAAPVSAGRNAGAPIVFSFSDGLTNTYFYLDDESLELSCGQSLGMEWKIEADWNSHLPMFTATASRKHAYLPGYEGSATVDIDAKGIRLYTGGGDVDITAAFREGGADISGSIDDDAISGTLTVAQGLWKLTLNDGHNVYGAVLRADENGFELDVDLVYYKFTAGAEWNDRHWGFHIGSGENGLSFDLDRQRDEVTASWDLDLLSPYVFHEATFTVGPESIRSNCRLYIDTGRYFGFGAEFEISRDGEDPGLYLRVENENGGETVFICRPAQITFINGGQTTLLRDVTPEGSVDRNVTQIAVYNAYTYYSGYWEENSVKLDDCYTVCEIVTEAMDGKYDITLSSEGESLFELTLDFEPAVAEAVPSKVLWLTPELFRLMYGIVSNAAETAEEMPIPVYAQETQPRVYEETDVPAALEMYVPVGRDSDSVIITQVQQRLYELGVLSTGDIQSGVLDQGTLEAVSIFQDRINTLKDAGLYVIDPADPGAMISANTLWWMFDADIGPYA